MKKPLKLVFLKSILYNYLAPKTTYRNAKVFFELCNGVFDAMEALGIESFSIKDLMDFKYVVSIAKNLPDKSGLKIFLLSLPCMKNDFTYEHCTYSKYAHSIACSIIFMDMPSELIMNQKGIEFTFSINVKSLNFDLKVNEQIVNGEIEHLNDVKSYVLENDVDLKQDRMLHDISNYLKLMKY